MNYTLIEPPKFTDTLDFENVNAPFIVLDKNQFFLSKKVTALWNIADKLDIFTDKDSINLISNGVSNFFKFKQKSSTVEIVGSLVIISDRYTKDDTLETEITPSTPLNMKELVTVMLGMDFLASEKIYKVMLNKTLLQLSNMVSYDDISAKCIKRTVTPVELRSPSVEISIMSEAKIISRDIMEDEFIHKTKEIAQVLTKNDNILNVKAEAITVSDVEFVNGYIPTSDNDSISVKHADDNSYRLDIPTTDSIFIHTPEGNRAPINRKFAEKTSEKYVSTTKKNIDNIIIKRDIPTINGEFVLSYDEGKFVINDYFDKIIDPTINSFDEFKNYLKSLCDFGEDYIPSDFSIKGGKIYIGFDYNNMFSVFNSEAIKKVLFDEVGDFDIRKGIVFDSSRYFKNQTEIDKLAAYAQIVSRDFDISNDTIGQVFLQMRGIIAKLCVLTPDAVPNPEDPIEIPVFKPSTTIVPMQLPSLVVSYLNVYIDEPHYIREYKLFILTPPVINVQSRRYVPSQHISAPTYVEEFIFTMSTPPSFSFPPVSYSGPALATPTGGADATYNVFARDDAKKDRLVFFTASNGCKKRYKVTSTRTINMMEMGVALGSLGNFAVSWYDYQNSITMPASLGAVSFLSDVACIISSETDYYINIDISLEDRNSIGTSPGSNPGDVSGCVQLRGGAGDVSSLPVPDRIKIKYEPAKFGFNGITVDSYGGGGFGPNSLTGTELTSSSLDSTNPCVFTNNRQYRDEEWWAAARALALSILSQVNQYISGRRLDDWNSIIQRPAKVMSLDKAGKNGGDYVLAEYVNTTHSISSAGTLTSIADQAGIFFSDMGIDTTIKALVHPYDNIMLGSHSAQAVGDRLAYMASPPSPKGGDSRIYIWAPKRTADMQRIEKMSYVPLSSSSKGIVTTFEPVVYLEKRSNGSYRYDVSGGGAATSGRGMFYPAGYQSGTPEKKEMYTLIYEGKTIVLGETEKTSTPVSSSYTRDKCDPWESPFEVYGILGADTSGIGGASASMAPMMVFAGGSGKKENVEIQNVQVRVEGGCGEETAGTSGIDPEKEENISNLQDIDPETLAQKKGDTPGAIRLNLNMHLSKYAPDVDTSGPRPVITKEVIKNTSVKLCLTFGIIDGKADGDGDILAQGLTQEEIDDKDGEPKVYIAPNSLTKGFTTCTRIQSGDVGASVMTFQLAALLTAEAIEVDSGKPFTKYVDPEDGNEKDAVITLYPESEDLTNEAVAGIVSTGGFTTAGISYYYKHAGQDPKKPVVQGYQGSSEVNFIEGRRIAATVAAPIPNVTVTHLDSADEIISGLTISGQNYIHFFLNNKTIQIVIGDTTAAFSENRTVKIIQE